MRFRIAGANDGLIWKSASRNFDAVICQTKTLTCHFWIARKYWALFYREKGTVKPLAPNAKNHFTENGPTRHR